MIKHCTQLFQRALPQRWLRILLKFQSDYRLPTLTLSRLPLCVFMWWSLRAEILNKYLILLSFLSLLELSGTDSSFGIGMMPRNPFHCEFQPNNELCLKNSLVNGNHQLCINIFFLFIPAAVDVRGQVRSLCTRERFLFEGSPQMSHTHYHSKVWSHLPQKLYLGLPDGWEDCSVFLFVCHAFRL